MGIVNMKNCNTSLWIVCRFLYRSLCLTAYELERKMFFFFSKGNVSEHVRK